MNPNEQAWRRLAAAARRAPAEARDDAAPLGFAARVAARAMAEDYPRVSLLEQFSLRALGAACLLTVGALGAGSPALLHILSHPSAPAVALSPPAVAVPADVTVPAAPAAAPSADDPVAELVDRVS